MTKYDWPTIQAAMPTFRPVSGGYTLAQRGIVTLEDNETVFIKLAVDDKTQAMLAQERQAYHWLSQQQFPFAPELLAESSNALVLPDLSARDWADSWDEHKLAAVFTAMDALAELSPKAMGVFGASPYDTDYWPNVPAAIQAYDEVELTVDDREALAALLSDTAKRQQLVAHSANEPWRGDRLVHYDVRADNFAYDATAKRGLLVDWNWLGFGSSLLDQTALLVNVQLSGFNVLPEYASRLDKKCLAWLIGYWLSSATGDQSTPTLKRLRSRVTHSALVAAHLWRQL
jgi:Ser/Thr protein kinase RdoA (MazF antagonist)